MGLERNDGNTQERPLDGIIYRLWVCDKDHMAVTFMAKEREACPLCDAKGLHRCLEEESRYFSNGQVFYRNIVHQIGDMFGEAARTSDDGSVQDDVLALKVPELVRNAVDRLEQVLEAPYFHPERKHRRRVVAHSRTNPYRHRRRVSTGAAVLLSACAGFIAGMFSKSKGTN